MRFSRRVQGRTLAAELGNSQGEPHMPGNTSFYYGIFKRLQGVYYNGLSPANFGHMDPNAPMGGFSLRTPHDMHGLFGKIGTNPTMTWLQGQSPLANSATPTDSPIYNMLSGSVGPNNVPEYVPVGPANTKWPTMPPGDPPGPIGMQGGALYLEFNSASPPQLVSALGNWIANGKPDDTPQAAPFLALPGGPPKAFPGAEVAILFAASFPNDDGRRPGDGDTNDPGPNYVPHNYWATSPIALLNEQGQFPVPTPLTLGKDEEYYLCALVGNSAATGSAGRAFSSNLPMNVICDALCFGTFMSPAVPLPSFANFDPADVNPIYEQYALTPMSYDVVAFRFNVNSVFAALAAGLAGYDLGGAQPAAWLQAGHPCVKVMVLSGEYGIQFPPAGNPKLSIDSNPAIDRHIAQHNLQPFDMKVMALAHPMWTNFIASQAGPGANGLLIQHPGWPAEATRLYFAIPSRPFERYVRAGGHRGFEVVREGVKKPFPDCVILRQTVPGARLEIADHDPGHDPVKARHHHGPDRFFGMAIGVAADPRHLGDHRLGDIEVVHTARDGKVVGGFSLRPVAVPR